MNSQLFGKLSSALVIAAGVSAGLTACGIKGGELSKNKFDKSQCIAAPVQTASVPINKGMVVGSITYNVIVPTYKALSQATREFLSAVITLRNERSQANLELAQQAWRAARTPWESSEGFLFGPVDAFEIDPQLDTWPLPITQLERIIASRPNATADFVRAQGNETRGYHTAEYLIFGDGIYSNTKSIGQMTTAQLNYLVATAQVLVEDTEKLENAWTIQADPENNPSLPGYAEVFANPGPNNEKYSSVDNAIEELLAGIEGITAEIATAKLGGPFGDSAQTADASKVESQFSWNSITDFKHNIESIRAIYTGDTVSPSGVEIDGAGLNELVKTSDCVNFDAIMNGRLEAAINALDAIPGDQKLSFSEAIKDESARPRVQKAIEAVQALDQSLIELKALIL